MKVAILTMFSGLSTTYSLVNVVADQIKIRHITRNTVGSSSAPCGRTPVCAPKHGSALNTMELGSAAISLCPC